MPKKHLLDTLLLERDVRVSALKAAKTPPLEVMAYMAGYNRAISVLNCMNVSAPPALPLESTAGNTPYTDTAFNPKY